MRERAIELVTERESEVDSLGESHESEPRGTSTARAQQNQFENTRQSVNTQTRTVPRRKKTLCSPIAASQFRAIEREKE